MLLFDLQTSRTDTDLIKVLRWGTMTKPVVIVPRLLHGRQEQGRREDDFPNLARPSTCKAVIPSCLIRCYPTPGFPSNR